MAWSILMTFFCVQCSSGSQDDLDSQLDQVGSPGSAQTRIFEIYGGNFCIYKWLLFFIGEIISRN